jgi:hypothetical protein
MEVQLRGARIPYIGAIAHHYWLVVIEAGEAVRWEVWQRPAAGGVSWGHLHRNLRDPGAGVGNGPSWVAQSWRDEPAARLADRLLMAPERYPWRHRYRPWPGPNSNTFVSWILEDPAILSWHALGKRYHLLRP